MTYLVSTLITRSWNLSGIVSEALQTVTAAQTSKGLDLLNDLLAFKSIDVRLIPYFTNYTLNAVAGQESYFIPNLISAETITFNVSTVRFPIEPLGRKTYFGNSRVDGVQSLPNTCRIERGKGGATLYLYFLPDSNYPISIWGKFGFSKVTLNTDLETLYDDYYLVYLRYALAKFICDEYNITFQPQAQNTLNELESYLVEPSPMDLTLIKRSTFNGQQVVNWAMANLYTGYMP